MFDWLLLIALDNQELGLNQAVRSRVGAIGVMQMLDEYFDDPALDSLNHQLFAFAAYNAGPTRIQQLRRDAAAQGLDATKWFDNVELVAGRRIGRETVQFVSNVFKSYVAYKLSVELPEEREAAT